MEQAQHQGCGACWVPDTSCPLCIVGSFPLSPFSILAGELEVGLIFSSVAWGQWELLLRLSLGAGKIEGKPGLARQPSVRLSRLFYVPGAQTPCRWPTLSPSWFCLHLLHPRMLRSGG